MTFFEPEVHPLQPQPYIGCAEANPRLLFQPSLQLAQRPIGMVGQQSGQHFRVEPTARSRPVRLPLYLAAALAGRRNLPCPAAAYPETQSQLGQACLPLVVRLQQLSSQIVRIRSRHLSSCRGSSPPTTLHHQTKCFNVQSSDRNRMVETPAEMMDRGHYYRHNHFSGITDWEQRMVNEFGQRVVPFLGSIWDRTS